MVTLRRHPATTHTRKCFVGLWHNRSGFCPGRVNRFMRMTFAAPGESRLQTLIYT